MKQIEITALDDGDLKLQLEKFRKELFDLRCKSATESLDNPRRIPTIRRSIARMLTEQRRREVARKDVP